jgi:glycosyltransferase involved in cell wall biosynthesis
MKLLLDLRPLQTGSAFRGIGRYVAGVAEAMRLLLPPEDLWALVLVGRSTEGLPEGYRLFPVQRENTDWRLASWLEEGAKLCGDVSRIAPDIYHHTMQFIPPRLPHPIVISIHDAIPILFPQGISRNEKLIFLASYWGLHSANMLLTGSQNSINDLGRIFHLPPEHFALTSYGISRDLIPPTDPMVREEYLKSLGIRPPYLVYGGGGEPRKDMPFLLETFRLVTAFSDEMQLVITGHSIFHVATRRLTHEMGLSGRVIFTGNTSQSGLATIYAGGFAYLQSTKYEGFGLPPLEAMSLGCPVISRANSSLPEVLDDAAVFIPREEPAAMAEVIKRWLDNPAEREEYIRRGIAWARKFTWERCAAQAFGAYQKVLSLL